MKARGGSYCELDYGVSDGLDHQNHSFWDIRVLGHIPNKDKDSFGFGTEKINSK